MPEAAAQPGQALASTLPPPSVLLVDDRLENLLALESVLGDLGARLVRAGSGAEALKRLLEADFALILLDVQMPELDGFQTATLIRQREKSRRTPILFLTALSTSDQYVFKGYSFGAVDYVIKPFAPEILKAKVGVFLDLFRSHELVRAQSRKLEEVNADLRRSNRELEEFASLASHDLQEPLRKAAAFGKLLKERCASKLDTTESQFLDYALGALERMQGLIHAVLELARLGRQVRKEPVELGKLLDEALLDLGLQLEEVGATVTRDELPRMPADRRLLGRVLQNLIANAVRFRGEKAPRIHVSASRQDSQWVISVKDNGIGIDPKQHEEIFRLFNRAIGPKGAGAGIGLALCRRAIEHQGGKIWVESRAGKGATFRFSIPAETNPSSDGEGGLSL